MEVLVAEGKAVATAIQTFHAADWSSWQALLRLRSDCLRLVLDLLPDHGDA